MIDFRIHQVAYSEHDDNGFMGVQFDAFGEKDSGMPTLEAHFPTGYAARPLDPPVDADGAPQFGCNVMIGWEGEEAHAFPLSDPRSRLVTAVLQKGESMMYGAVGNFVRMHADGRISLFTTDDATPNGKTVALQIKPNGLLFSAPWGKITFDATGFHVLHSSGAAIDLGAVGGLPAPLSALGSYVKLTGAMVQTEASVISSGTTAGVSDAAVKATPLLSVLAALSTALTDLATMLPTLTNGGGPVTAPTLAATATAITATVTAITAATPLLPSLSSAVT